MFSILLCTWQTLYKKQQFIPRKEVYGKKKYEKMQQNKQTKNMQLPRQNILYSSHYLIQFIMVFEKKLGPKIASNDSTFDLIENGTQFIRKQNCREGRYFENCHLEVHLQQNKNYDERNHNVRNWEVNPFLLKFCWRVFMLMRCFFSITSERKKSQKMCPT